MESGILEIHQIDHQCPNCGSNVYIDYDESVLFCGACNFRISYYDFLGMLNPLIDAMKIIYRNVAREVLKPIYEMFEVVREWMKKNFS